MIVFERDVCGNLSAGLEREWLETNGIGGFASSTISGINSRRYHGLLTAALRPPVGRSVLLSKLEETVFLNGAKYDLSANIYPGTVHPQGYTHLKRFRLDPYPIFTYEVGGVELEKRVYMVQGENSTVIEYRMAGNASCTLDVRPLIAFRDYHSTTHANNAIDGEISEEKGVVSIQPYGGLPRLYFRHNARWVNREGNWYYNFEYPRERERGLDCHEDLFEPLMLQFELGIGAVASIVASTEPKGVPTVIATRSRRTDGFVSPLTAALTVAANQFIVRRAGNLHTIIAGYHWFSDWGRDTMIALPGLTLATGRFEIARDILLAFSRAADQGMLPNRFPDSGEKPEYNTVDASLWFFETIRKYCEYTQEYEWVKSNLYETMKSIIDSHLRGTRYGIHCGADGLISAGGPDTQLTWMDAKVGDVAATPRHGKPVEVQALWYNALAFTAALAGRFEDCETANRCDEIARRAHTSFNEQFWNAGASCLYDVVRENGSDGSIRPNQVIALSLGYSMVPADRAASLLKVVERELLTPYGLRTLSPEDPDYRGECDGGAAERDASYHQGTVWPWLLGPFITAHVKTHGTVNRKWLKAFSGHLLIAGLGTISEIFDGDAPHQPRGCVAQAWSVAEILRVLVEHAELWKAD